MKFYEVNALLEKHQIIERESWEQTRLIAYCIAQSNCKKKLKATDIIKFPWEKEEKQTLQLSQLDKENLKSQMDNFIAKKNKDVNN